MNEEVFDKAAAFLKQSLTLEQQRCLAVMIAAQELDEAETRETVRDDHEFRSAIALGVLTGLGVTNRSIDTVKQSLQQANRRNIN